MGILANDEERSLTTPPMSLSEFRSRIKIAKLAHQNLRLLCGVLAKKSDPILDKMGREQLVGEHMMVNANELYVRSTMHLLSAHHIILCLFLMIRMQLLLQHIVHMLVHGFNIMSGNFFIAHDALLYFLDETGSVNIIMTYQYRQFYRFL